MAPAPGRIGARHPLRHVGSVVHETGRGVCGCCLDGTWMAVATAHGVSVWRLGLPAGRDGLLQEAMRHELESEQRRVVSHLALRNGLVVACGQSRVAKRRREKAGVLSQINPGVFVLASDLTAGHDHVAAAAGMSDVDIPSVMATWDSFGGLSVGSANAGAGVGAVVLLADTEGQVVRWTLDARRSDAARPSSHTADSQLGGRRSAQGVLGRAGPKPSLPQGQVSIARCAKLQSATGWGALKSLIICGPGDRYAAAALQHALAIWNHEDGSLLQTLHVSAFGPRIIELNDVAPWSGLSAAKSGQQPVRDGADDVRMVVSLNSVRTRAPTRATRCGSQAPSWHALGSEAKESQAGSPAPVCELVQIDPATGHVTPCRQLLLFDDARTAGGGRASQSSAAEEENDWTAVAASSSSVVCDLRHVVAGFPSGTVAVWNAASARLVALLRDSRRDWKTTSSQHSGGVCGSAVTSVAVHPTRCIIAAGRSDGVLDVWAPSC